MEKTNWKEFSFEKKVPMLNEIINLSNYHIVNYVDTFYVDYETLVNNFEKFLFIVKLLLPKGTLVLMCDSYESARFINNNLKEKLDVVLNIADDFENKDRTDVIVAEFDKVRITVPLAHLMWGVDFDNLVYINSMRFGNNIFAANGNRFFTKEDLESVKNYVEVLNALNPISDLEKIILISNFLQARVEYIGGNTFWDKHFEYSLKSPLSKDEIKSLGYVEKVLERGFGLCIGIANATTMLLNNPVMNVDVRTVGSYSHAWNIIKIGGKYYLIDNTFNITKSKSINSEAIRTLLFNLDYLLFGTDFASIAGKHNAKSFNPNLSLVENESYNSLLLEKTVKSLEHKSAFEYPVKVIKPIIKTKL